MPAANYLPAQSFAPSAPTQNFAPSVNFPPPGSYSPQQSSVYQMAAQPSQDISTVLKEVKGLTELVRTKIEKPVSNREQDSVKTFIRAVTALAKQPADPSDC